MRERGRDIPPDLPETAALLHDVDKAPPLRALRAALGHGTAGASWLAGRGFAELGPAIAGHPATRLADEAEFNRWLREATPTELIVSYADKRAMKDVVPLNRRFAKWQAQQARTCRDHRPRAGPRRSPRGERVCRRRHNAGRSDAPAVGRRAAQFTSKPGADSSLAYFWGEDAFGLEQAARRLAADISADAGQPAEIWRTGTTRR